MIYLQFIHLQFIRLQPSPVLPINQLTNQPINQLFSSKSIRHEWVKALFQSGGPLR